MGGGYAGDFIGGKIYGEGSDGQKWFSLGGAFAGAMAGEHATKMLSDRLHRIAKKRWLQAPALDKCA